MRHRPIIVLVLSLLSLEHGVASGDREKDAKKGKTERASDKISPLAEDKRALGPWQGVVGRWRGTGQVKRGSTRGVWREDASWIWRFEKGRAYLDGRLSKGKYFSSLRLARANKDGSFVLTAKLPESTAVATYAGKKEKDGQLALLLDPVRSKSAPGSPARLSLRLLADDKRLVLLYEGRRAGSERFYRLGEVGFTRKGETIAAGAGFPECVVTGGRGTIDVEHAGEKYLVCCSGCRDAFDDNPAEVLAEYRQRKKQEAAKKAAKKAKTNDAGKSSRSGADS